MELGVGFFEIGDGQTQIPFGRGQRAMSQQVLDMAEVGVVLEQMRCHRVSPDITGDVLFHICKPGMFLDDIPHGVRIEWATAQGEKQLIRDITK